MACLLERFCPIHPRLAFSKGGEVFPFLTKGDERGLDLFFKALKCYEESYSLAVSLTHKRPKIV
jgi:hypothetical protein